MLTLTVQRLIFSFAKRELLGRYKGSALGIAWAVLTPVVMIAIFTFIFAGIFGARFGVSNSHWDYALYLFCGLLPWTMFQESVQQSASTIITHANLVKRVVFPLETLPAAQVFAALGNQLFATVGLLIATVAIRQELHLTTLWLPVLLIPQLMFALGCASSSAKLGEPVSAALTDARMSALDVADALANLIANGAASPADREYAYRRVSAAHVATAADALGRAIVAGRLMAYL